MSSASSEKPEKQKTKKSHFSIIAVKRKKKKPAEVSDSAAKKDETSSLGSEGTDYASEIYIQRQQPAMAAETRIAELTQQLEAEKQKGAEFERMLEESQSEVMKWQEKVMEFEKIGNDLDDDSFAAAQEFQFKKQVEYLKAELEKHADIAEELERTQEELQEVRSQYDELEFQVKRNTTRTAIKSISEDKSAREEVARLQKDLRQMDFTLQKQTSQLEAQVKVSEESLHRAQEKALAIQRRLDEVDNEKLQLKIENKRLQRKLEKQGTYSERKRLETEKETRELEVQNLRRQRAKLERFSTSQQSLDLLGSLPVSPEGSRPSSRISDQDSFTDDASLSEMRIRKLEMELNKMEAAKFTLNKDNVNLKEELASTKQSEERLTLEVERLRKSLEDGKAEYAQLEAEDEELRSRASAGSDEEYIKKLQANYEKLEKVLGNKEVEFRVKEKNMRATNEELKRQMEELEIAKLRAELGEPEEGEEEEDLTDVEDDEEVSHLRERLNSLQIELDSVKTNNDSLKDEMEKKKQEADELLKTIEEELEDVEALEVSREDKLSQRNEELKAKLKEQSKKFEETLHEIVSLRETVFQQEEEIAILQIRGSQAGDPVSNDSLFS